MKKVLIILLSVILAFGCITACVQGDDEPVQLWVVTEETTSEGLNAQVRYYMEQFQSAHPNVSFHLDILPTESTERAEYIKELYDKIEPVKVPIFICCPLLTCFRPMKPICG